MHCSNCGNSLQEGTRFCGKCGHAISRNKSGIFFFKKWLLGGIFVLIVISILTFKYVLPFLATKGISPLPLYKGSIQGTVYKTDGKTPLEGAEIFLEGRSEKSRSDSGGKFYFYEVPMGAYKVVAKKEGHKDATSRVKITRNGNTSTSLTLPINPVVRGSKIIAEKTDSSKGVTEIWIMNPDGSNKQKLIEGSQPEILKSDTEIIVTRVGKRYQAYLDGSGEQLVGTEAPLEHLSVNRKSPLPQKTAVSPDNKKTAFVESGDIWLLEGNNKTRLTTLDNNSAEGLFWVNDDQILYLSTIDSKFSVSLLNSKTKEAREIFNGSYDIFWSHNHQYFAVNKYVSGSCSFCSDEKKKEMEDNQKDNGIWIYKTADGSNRIVTEGKDNIYQSLNWIPNSSLLTFVVSNSKNKENNGLYLVKADNETDKAKLILKETNNIDFEDASWSVNKDALVTKSGYLLKLDGSPAKRITDKTAQFNWLPSGKVIYTLSGEKSTWITADGDNQQKLTDNLLNLYYSLSKDGKNILMDGGGYIWTMDINGENLKQITAETGYKNPQWL